MTGAMYAAIAGLRTHMQNLNVIGNNVANVNTTAYKAGRSVFRTSLYTTQTGGSNGTATTGGVNPTQIGYGSQMTNVDIDMSTGNLNVTGNSTDMMLDGTGFFLVGSKTMTGNFDGTIQNDKQALASLTLTRTGNFNFKADGYLTDGGGNVVYGFLCIGTSEVTGEPIFSDQLVPIRFPRVYTDNDGTVQIGYARPGGGIDTTNDSFAEYYDRVKDEENLHILDYGAVSLEEDSQYTMASFTNITVSETGVITGTCEDRDGEPITIGCIAIGNVTNPNGVTQIGDTYYQALDGAGQLTVGVSGGTSNIKDANDQMITKINQSLLGEDAEDEDPTTPEDPLRIRNTDTGIIGGGLEMSKTDLAQEIANMILTQRGYQANTRIVTVTDSMLEELVNMKR